MKKLGKKVNKNTLQAFIDCCGCKCGCGDKAVAFKQRTASRASMKK